MNNPSIYSNNMLESDDSILLYEFKQELRINHNNSLYLSSENSGIVKDKLKQDLDNLILEYNQKCINKYEELFYNTIMHEYIEDGYISDSQRLYKVIQEEYGNNVSSLFLNEIYKKYASYDKVIKSLLYIMSSQNPKDLNGNVEAIIAFSLMHKDYEIRDHALQCFEKWNDTKYLNLLKTLNMNVDFLQEYLNYIIKSLEIKRDEENVH